MATNKFGLDTRYLNKNFRILIRDSTSYTPEEMQRALQKLADVAGSQIKPKPGEANGQ